MAPVIRARSYVAVGLIAVLGALGCGEPFASADAPRDDCVALRFTGEQMVEVPDAADLDLAEPVTIEFRMNLAELAGEMHVVSHHDYPTAGYQLGVQDANLDFRLYRTSGRWLGQGTVSPGRWHHVAAEWDGGRYWLYLDGSVVADGEVEWFPADYAGPFRIGAASYAEAFFFDGLIDEVRVSRGLRYQREFDVPGGPVVVDADTIALWRFDDEQGQVVSDATGNHPGVLGASEATRPDDPVREAGHCLEPILPQASER